MKLPRRTMLRLLGALPLVQLRAQQSGTPSPERRRVVPIEVIEKFKLRPAENLYGPWLRGMDGQPYDFDDVMWAVFEMTKEHWQLRK